MFLSVEWAKRWLPAVFLWLSLFLPWWICGVCTPSCELTLSFPWGQKVQLYTYIFDQNMSFFVLFDFPYHRLPVSCFVSALIFVSGLFGLSVRSKIRTLGGLLGGAGIISYSALVLPESMSLWVYADYTFSGQMRDFPYFGYGLTGRYGLAGTRMLTWFLSAGFYLALAGSLMLLLPLIRTLVERLKKRLKSS